MRKRCERGASECIGGVLFGVSSFPLFSYQEMCSGQSPGKTSAFKTTPIRELGENQSRVRGACICIWGL